MYFVVYVNDIILTGNNNSAIDDFVLQLNRRFALKDLGELHHFLGVDVISTSDGLFLSQSKHIRDILTNHKMADAKPVITPMQSATSLVENSAPSDPTKYRQIIGALQYLAITRPNIAFVTNRLSQSMHAPNDTQMQALKRLLRYLKGTIHHDLFLKRGQPLRVTAFSDSDWGGASENGRSTTGYAIYLGPNIISWKSMRQKSVSRSSTEAEYKAIANASSEVTWITHLLSELGVTLAQTPVLYCDNIGAT